MGGRGSRLAVRRGRSSPAMRGVRNPRAAQRSARGGRVTSHRFAAAGRAGGRPGAQGQGDRGALPAHHLHELGRALPVDDRRAQARPRAGERDAMLTFSTTIQKHHRAPVDPTKDSSLCSIKVASERDAELAQKLGQLQPFIAVFPQECMGQLASFGPT